MIGCNVLKYTLLYSFGNQNNRSIVSSPTLAEIAVEIFKLKPILEFVNNRNGHPLIVFFFFQTVIAFKQYIFLFLPFIVKFLCSVTEQCKRNSSIAQARPGRFTVVKSSCPFVVSSLVDSLFFGLNALTKTGC